MIGGKCVRLTRGDYDTQKVYNENPLDVARAFEDVGCRRLHLVDLDGAKSKHIVNYNVLERIAGHTDLCIDFGGGLKSDDDLRIAFDSGAKMVTGGSIAVSRRDLFLGWLERYGSDRIILGADSRGGHISTNGWLDDSDENLLDFVKAYAADGVTQVISTDIDKDGMAVRQWGCMSKCLRRCLNSDWLPVAVWAAGATLMLSTRLRCRQ